MFAEDIIIKPLLTEKGYDGLADKKYMFIVRKSADKTQIKQAVEKLFGVSIIVSLTTVPFCSISSEFTRQQLCICCAK